MSAFSPTDDALATAGRDDRYDLLSRHGRPGRLPPEGSARITRRITALALALGVVMALGKIYLFLLTGSVGVLSSLVHSALDIFAASSSFIAVRVAALRPKAHYRFGFGKAESFSAVFQVCLIGLAAFHLFGASLDALGAEHVFHSAGDHDHAAHAHAPPVEGSVIAITVLGLFAVLTVWLLIAQSWAIRATGSIAVRGDRAHYLADLFGNLFVMAGLAIATFTAARWADAAVGRADGAVAALDRLSRGQAGLGSADGPGAGRRRAQGDPRARHGRSARARAD